MPHDPVDGIASKRRLPDALGMVYAHCVQFNGGMAVDELVA